MSALWYLIISLVVGGIAGWLAGEIVKGRGFGVVVNVILGIIGGVVGGVVLSFIGLGNLDQAYGILGSILVSTIGAILVLVLASALFPRTQIGE